MPFFSLTGRTVESPIPRIPVIENVGVHLYKAVDRVGDAEFDKEGEGLVRAQGLFREAILSPDISPRVYLNRAIPAELNLRTSVMLLGACPGNELAVLVALNCRRIFAYDFAHVFLMNLCRYLSDDIHYVDADLAVPETLKHPIFKAQVNEVDTVVAINMLQYLTQDQVRALLIALICHAKPGTQFYFVSPVLPVEVIESGLVSNVLTRGFISSVMSKHCDVSETYSPEACICTSTVPEGFPVPETEIIFATRRAAPGRK